MADGPALDKALADFDKELEDSGVDASTDTHTDELTDERRQALRKKYPALTMRR